MVSLNRSFAVLAAPKRQAREGHVKRPWIAVGLAVALMTGVGTPPAQADEGSVFLNEEYQELGTASSKAGGVVAAGNREAALAGLKMLDDGGNAVDAAAATMFAVGVAQFDSCGIGGGGFIVYRSASGEVDTIDFREWSPKKYVFTDGFGVKGFPGYYAWGGGHNVVGIPGSVAGIDLALKKHGTRSLKHDPKDGMSVLEPAIELAVNGFTVPKSTADYIGNPFVAPRLVVFPATAAIYMGAPAYYNAGQKMRNEPLAEDMLELKRLGRDAFYDPDLRDGTIADDLLAEMTWRPSPDWPVGSTPLESGWEADDLRAYEAISRPAVRTRYRGSEYIGMAAPSSAGTAVAEVLNILEGYDLRAAGQSSADQVHLFAEAMKLAWRDRGQYLADPDFTPTPAHLTSKEHADSLRDEIDLDLAQAFGGTAPHGEGHNTHNIAVIDKWGNAVALNCSIEQQMGSGVTAVGTGFLLNNQLTDFDNDVNHVNKPEPRKRPRSSQGPAIVVRQGKPALVTGGVGGAGIIAATASAVLNVVDFRQDVAHAIDAERAEPRGNCPPVKENPGRQLCLETTRFDADVLDDLGRRGHTVKASSANRWIKCYGTPPCEYAAQPFTHSAGIHLPTGERQAASDPRVFASGDPTGLAAVAQAEGG